MAKAKPPRRDRNPSATRAIATVTKYHRIGRMALAGHPKGTKPGGATNARLAEAEKVSTALVRQARIFARVYDTEERLNTLLALRDSGGMPLTWAHVQQLFLVEDEAVRTALQVRAADKGWSAKRLRREVLPLVKDKRTVGAKRRNGGPRFRKPDGPEDALRRLVELSRPWLKYYDDIVADGGQSILAKIAEAAPIGSDSEFLKQLGEAQDVLKRVERAARKAASRLQEAESKAQQQQQEGTKSAGDPSPQTVRSKRSRPSR